MSRERLHNPQVPPVLCYAGIIPLLAPQAKIHSFFFFFPSLHNREHVLHGSWRLLKQPKRKTENTITW